MSRVPVINAGDGNGGQHPTQALLDLYTIYRERRSLDGLTIAIVGELDRGRTARSLAYLLSKFERVKIHFVSPPEVQMQPDILEHLDEHDVWYDVLERRRAGRRRGRRRLPDAHPPRPRRPDRATSRATPSTRACCSRMKPDAMILHPLPRTVEIDKAVDDDPRALYFRQATNGLFVRMALLTMLWDRTQDRHARPAEPETRRPVVGRRPAAMSPCVL